MVRAATGYRQLGERRTGQQQATGYMEERLREQQQSIWRTGHLQADGIYRRMASTGGWHLQADGVYRRMEERSRQEAATGSYRV